MATTKKQSQVWWHTSGIFQVLGRQRQEDGKFEPRLYIKTLFQNKTNKQIRKTPRK
jgi:hypothetical protein